EEVRPLAGHQGAVSALAFSKDGARLFSAGRDRKIHAWELATGRETRSPRHPYPIRVLSVSPDREIVVGSETGLVERWRGDDAQLLAAPTMGLVVGVRSLPGGLLAAVDDGAIGFCQPKPGPVL